MDFDLHTPKIQSGKGRYEDTVKGLPDELKKAVDFYIFHENGKIVKEAENDKIKL